MKKLVFLTLFALFGAFQCLNAQINFEDNLTQLKNESILNHLDESVDLQMNADRKVYSKKQAQALLKKFFEENQWVKFEKKHAGTTNGQGILMGIVESKSTKFSLTIKYDLDNESHIKFVSIKNVR